MVIVVLVIIHFTGPEREIVSDQLHNGGGVFVGVFLNVLDVGDGVVESLLGSVAGHGGVLLHFVAEHGIIKGEAEADGVGGLEVGAMSMAFW